MASGLHVVGGFAGDPDPGSACNAADDIACQGKAAA